MYLLLLKFLKNSARLCPSFGSLLGPKIKKAMAEQYGEKKGESVFYASANKGTIKGVHKDKPKMSTRYAKRG